MFDTIEDKTFYEVAVDGGPDDIYSVGSLRNGCLNLAQLFVAAQSGSIILKKNFTRNFLCPFMGKRTEKAGTSFLHHLLQSFLFAQLHG